MILIIFLIDKKYEVDILFIYKFLCILIWLMVIIVYLIIYIGVLVRYIKLSFVYGVWFILFDDIVFYNVYDWV